VPEKPTPRRAGPHSTPLARGGPMQRTSELTRTSGLERRTPLERSGGPQRTVPPARTQRPKRAAISPASPAQRAKIKGKSCVVCGAPATTPMHLWPRGKGGCDDPLCVLPACWACHRDYDTMKLDLLPHIVRRHLAEIAHAHLHAPPVAVLERLTASTVVLHSRIPRPSAASAPAL
jgi:hypothetical protein